MNKDKNQKKEDQKEKDQAMDLYENIIKDQDLMNIVIDAINVFYDRLLEEGKLNPEKENAVIVNEESMAIFAFGLITILAGERKIMLINR